MMVRITGVFALACLLVLGMAGTASADGHLVQLGASLTGAAELEGSGDLDGSGTASVTLNAETNEVCFDISHSGIDAPTAAHIHIGGAGSNGGVVVDLDWAGTGGTGCVSGGEAAVNGIMTNPSLYYVNVHNEAHPGGAIRGQLGPASDSTAPGGAELAFTGSSLTAVLAIIGSAAVAAGALMVGAERRNR